VQPSRAYSITCPKATRLRPHPLHAADDLMAGNNPFLVRRKIAFDNMKVRAAYATHFDPN
jgi:hypothetical protein